MILTKRLMMRRLAMHRLAAVLLMCLTLMSAVSCKGGKKTAEGVQKRDGVFTVALLINGNLGDKSFYDSANNGMLMIKDGLGCHIKVVEAGYDESKWEPALRDICDENYDIVITGTSSMTDIVSKVAPDYPDQKIIVYDTAVDYSADTAGVFKNTYSMEYKQNEGSYLAGTLAACMSQNGIIGFIGGMDDMIIRDFLVGYIQGAKDTNATVKVIHSYVGSWSDSAKAKELTFAQYQMGADVVFSVAANAGEGVLQASKEQNHLVIGVDSDQAMLHEASDPAMAALIMSSMLKRVDQSIYLAVERANKGTLTWGSREEFGIIDDCVGLADNTIYQKTVPEDVRGIITDKANRIKEKQIEVLSSFAMDNSAFTSYVDAVHPNKKF
ncbi:MAG: BMP family ABC transporter substrate-binding protein [Termitinemataceae bacterium]|nr:MAG: BMP family ABC transporter substrate-binding protein [Termitinemataceae bacterium]